MQRRLADESRTEEYQEMKELKNPLEIYKLLKKSNCGECRVPSCMAFAVAVVQGQKELAACPYLDRTVIASLANRIGRHRTVAEDQASSLQELQRQVKEIDFQAAAGRLGATFVNGRLAISCLGKDFLIDQDGSMASPCHVNFWVHFPLLNYVVQCQGAGAVGEWVTLGGLKGGNEWDQFFSHRVEEALRQVADAHAELFFEMLELFGAESQAGSSSADHSLGIRPLPRVPFLINYWAPEEGIDSKLNILFDRSAERNIDPGSIYYLGRGLVEMFRQLIIRHSRDGKLF
jgi:hypothetical protein